MMHAKQFGIWIPKKQEARNKFISLAACDRLRREGNKE